MEKEIWQAFKAKGVQVLGLAVAERDSTPDVDPIAKIREFRTRHSLTYPLLSDEDQTVFNRFGGGSIPACILVDQKGNFVAKLDEVEEIKKHVEALLP